MVGLPNGHSVTQMVADVTDVFWLIPNRLRERKYFVARYGNHFVLCLRTAQGFRNAGLTWGTIVALIGRCVSSLFAGDGNIEEGTRCAEDVKMQTYVDDPWNATRGTPTAPTPTWP